MSFTKFIASGAVAVALLGASIASAQTYSYNYSGGTNYSTGCLSISSNLSLGSRGTAVSQLQRFLVAQNYPGGGSWMVSGYFGQATAAAVRDFQVAHGLPQTGFVDAATSASITSASCGGSSYLPGLGGIGYTYPTTPTYPYSTAYPYTYPTTQYPYTQTNQYPYTYNPYGYNNYNYNSGSCGTYPYFYSCTNANYDSAPTLTSLSTTSGIPGAPVTVYGTGFDPISNTVYVGGTTLSNIPSNGTSLTFTLPSVAGGVVSISVGNSHGTSNALTLTVAGNPIVCGGYPYTTNCGTPYPPTYPCNYQYGYSSSYGYNNCPPNNTGTPTLSYLSPQSGAIGTAVTVYGSGFSTTGNTVHFGNGIIANAPSFDGLSVSFVVPASISGYGYQPIGLGTYNVSVSNAYGAMSNSLPFTITQLYQSGALSISNVSGPTTLGIGQSGTWTITLNTNGNTYSSVSVNWGDTGNGYVNMAAPTIVNGSGTQTLTFSHAYFSGGTFTITFTAAGQNGQSSAASATVSVGGSNNGSISLISLSPQSGTIGTQVVLTGSGFSATDNTVHFGVGGTMHVPSYNGTTLYYTIPSYVSPCDVTAQGTPCAQFVQQINPGTYQISVSNGSGTSQTLSFQVH